MFRTSRHRVGLRSSAVAAATTLILAACGGSGGESTDSEASDGSADDSATEQTDTDASVDDGASDPADDAVVEEPADVVDAEISVLEPAFTIQVDLAPGDGVELAVSPDGAYVASVSSQNDVTPERTLTTYEIATGAVVASVTAVEDGVRGSGPEWLADGRIVVRNGDEIAAWNGPELTPAEALPYDDLTCQFGIVVDPTAGASYALMDFVDPPVLCRMDLTTGEVTTAPVADVDRWFFRGADGTVSLEVRDADDNSMLVTLDSTTLEEVSSEALPDLFSATNAGLLIGEGAETVLVPGDIPIPSGRLDGGARLSDNGQMLIAGGSGDEIWFSTDDGSPIGQVVPGFATWQYGWSRDDSVLARPVASPEFEVESIAVHVFE